MGLCRFFALQNMSQKLHKKASQQKHEPQKMFTPWKPPQDTLKTSQKTFPKCIENPSFGVGGSCSYSAYVEDCFSITTRHHDKSALDGNVTEIFLQGSRSFLNLPGPMNQFINPSV